MQSTTEEGLPEAALRPLELRLLERRRTLAVPEEGIERVVKQVRMRVGGGWFERVWQRPGPLLGQLLAVGWGLSVVAFLDWAWWSPLVTLAVWWLGLAAVPEYLLGRPPGMPNWARAEVELTSDERRLIGESERAAAVARKAATSGAWELRTGRDLWLIQQRVKLQSDLARAVRTPTRE